MSKKYFVFNEEPNTSILGLGPLIEAIVSREMKEIGGRSLSILPFEMDRGKFRAMALSSEFADAADFFLDRIVSDHKFEESLVGAINERIREIKEYCITTLAELDAGSLDEDGYRKRLAGIFPIYSSMAASGLIPPIIEISSGGLSKMLAKIFIDKSGDQSTANKWLALLTYPFGFGYDHEIQKSLSEISQKVYESEDLRNIFAGENNENILSSLPKGIKKNIDNFVEKWGWAYFGYCGPEYGPSRAVGEIKGMIALDISPDNQLKKTASEIEKNRNEQRALMEKAGFSDQEKYLIKTAQDFSQTKGDRAKMMSLASYTISQLLKYFAKKESLSLKQLGTLVIGELLEYLQTGKLPEVDEMNRRLEYCLLIYRPDRHEFIYGEKARKWINDNVAIETVGEDVTEISGQIACQGDAGLISGRVKIINVESEMAGFEAGDILVSINTIPEIVPAMKKASAIITDIGGLTCHAAIVSRELNKPCIIGTRIATKFFKDGDSAEVDLTKGIIKKI